MKTRTFPWLPVLLAAASLVVTAASPVGAQVPTPESVIGWEPGADYKLADYGQIQAYFEALDAASDRIRVEKIGESAEGRPLLLAIISSEANMRSLERYREISRRLALAADLTDAEARALAEEGKAVVWIDAGIHATEVAGPQFSPDFAYRMVTSEEPELRRIRDEVVILHMPVMNPDGLEIVVDWYRRNLGTPYETVGLPVLYQKYAGHDNNRDWFMILQPETRAVVHQLWEEWVPQIIVNHHQTAPFPARIFIPPFADPVNPHIPPLVIAGVNLVGTAMQQRFAEEGKPGAVSRVRFTQWWNGGVRTAPYFHNQVGILTEVALHRYASPKYYEPDSLPKAFRGGKAADRPSVWYPDPWKGGWWRIGDAVSYFLTASMGVLEAAAGMRESWLFNIYQMGRDAIEQGAESPFAYLVALDRQQDPSEALELLRVLSLGGIRVERATAGFTAAGESFAAGTFVLRAAQPYRAHLVDLMEPQQYPDRRQYPGGPPLMPYDLTGWTLPLQMGVSVTRLDEPVEIQLEEVAELRPSPGSIAGEASEYLLAPGSNLAYVAVNRLVDAGISVGRLASPHGSGEGDFPPGTFVIRATADDLRPLAVDLGLDFRPAERGLLDSPEVIRFRAPAVGLYRSWVPSMDEGWARWVLERYGFDFTTLRDADIRGGGLEDLDAILLPHQSAEDILNGHTSGTMPEEYTGGLGLEGALQLKRWVEAGGTLIAVDGASDFVIDEFGLPVRNSVKDVSAEALAVPGSLLRLDVDSDDPIGFGIPEETAASFVSSRAFETVAMAGDEEGAKVEREEVDVAAWYGQEDLLLSGWELGAERYLAGRPAVMRVRVGEGQVVLIGFRSHFRGQPRATFKLLFNSMLAASSEEPAPENVAESE
ncbi:MAG: M14 family metallopeptidase [Gemmatimonadales bacterium]